ncbi:transcriptional regulator [Lactococcus termiticola]|uniref:MerR family transcriptional regulator n=1 Tax=Lactococcus termiticola TaxID=2169526 RepID=A0A2R5HGX2_9LACT|nr:transcriptional regulator [Lactococcus termiticola]GBG97254.1 MerR family transcriptional regulator [Lactococcus termiticola]
MMENKAQHFSDEDYQKLAATGMPEENLDRYRQLYEAGDASLIDRIRLLVEQEAILDAQFKAIERDLDFIRGLKRHHYEYLEQKNGS